jgi:transposase-like protein
MNLRRIARQVGVNHQSVATWVNAYAAQLPPAPLPEQVDTVEMDELHTFIADKKQSLHRDLCRPGHTLHSGLDGLPLRE